jgi:nucleoside-diphosphate-sugar epimerase
MTTRIFLAGATGVVGRRLIGLLLEGGHDVTAMTRRELSASGLRALGARAVVADALDPEALTAAVTEARPEVLIHQLTDLSGGTLATNAALRTRGTRHLVDAALAAGVRRVIAQSIAWAYEPGPEPAAESVALDLGAAPPRDVTIGGVAALERTVAELPEWVVLRYGLLYGPGTWYAADGRVADQARAGALPAGADIASFLHADDAAVAAAEALAWPSGAVNVCDDEPASGREWVPAFCRAVGAGTPPADDAPRTPWARGASNRYAREALGWTPRYASWRQGFATLAT